jgi:hypothetical protein
MVCLPATSEAEARWPRFGLVVVATNSRRDYLDQMIRPLMALIQQQEQQQIKIWTLRDSTSSRVKSQVHKPIGHLVRLR